MKYLFFLSVLLLTVGGCRFSVSAEKLQLSAAVDQTAYLSKEDPTTYTDEPEPDRDPVD